MKLTTKTADITQALSYCASATNRRAIIPILESCLVEAQDGVLSFTTSDLDSQATMKIEANVEESGRCCVSLSRLRTFIQSLSSDSVEVTLGDDLLIKGGSSKITFKVLPATGFPRVQHGEMVEFWSGESKAIAESIGWVSTARATENDQVLTKVMYLDGLTGLLYMTDRRRIHIAQTPIRHELVLPVEASAPLAIALTMSGECSLSSDGKFLLVTGGRHSLLQRQVQFEYPISSIRTMLDPDPAAPGAAFDIEALSEAARTISGLTKANPVTITLAGHDDGVRVYHEASELQVERVIGGSIGQEIYLDAHYVIDALKGSAGTTEVSVRERAILCDLNEGRRALVFRQMLKPNVA